MINIMISLFTLVASFTLQYTGATSACTIDSIIGYIVGPLLCLGSIVSYIPQCYIIVKGKTIEGINETSLVILNIGNFCLSLNSIILNWNKWSCFGKCGVWLCMAHLLPFYQILMGWIMVFVFYIVFMKYKIRNTENKLIGVMFYGLLYVGFIAIVIAIAVGEKIAGSGPTQLVFFHVFAQILGYTSAACSAVVWIPQIYTLVKTKQIGNLSPLMFALQTPGNVVIIIFQAVLFKQPVSTWITYVITCAEQLVILGLMTAYYIRDRNLRIRTHRELTEIIQDSDPYLV